MRTKVVVFDGVVLRVPAVPGFFWPHKTFDGFPSCCGPGDGIGSRIVPDNPFWLPLGPACWVHDEMFRWKEKKTWSNFYYSNGVFLTNVMEINRVKSKSRLRQKLREPLLWGYVKAVNTFVGARCFFRGEIVN